MAERDVSQFGIIATTQTSLDLGITSYREVRIALEQDFSLSRVIRGIGTKTFGVSLEDQSGPIDADGDVLITIYDAFSNLVESATTTKTSGGTGEYTYDFEPAADASLGIYKAVHSFTVGGSAGEIEEWTRVVSNVPGDYAGTVVRGHEEWEGVTTVVDNLGQAVDPDDNSVKYTIRDSRGVILVDNADAVRVGIGQYQGSYSPGHNDPIGEYHASFTYAISSTSGSTELFFNVSEKKSELAVAAQEFKDSVEGKSVTAAISTWSDDLLDEILADSQARVEIWTGNSFGKTVVTGERQWGSIDSKNRLSAQLNSAPVWKLLRVLLRYHPMVNALTLPVSAWEIYHELGQIKYLLQAGVPLATHVDNLLAESVWKDEVQLIVDYETGYDEIPRPIKQAIRLLAVTSINESEMGGAGAGDIKSIKSGNHQIQYHPDVTLSNKERSSSLTQGEKRAFDVLKMAGKIPPSIV